MTLLLCLAVGVVSGMNIEASGNRVIVSPGACTIGDRTVQVERAEFTIAPAESVEIRDEVYTLSSDKPVRYAKGTHLKACLFGDGYGTVLPGCLVRESVSVKLRDGTVMEEGKDYLLDTEWGALGRIEGGRIGRESEVLITYRASTMRLDAIVVSASGKPQLIVGQPMKTSPVPPKIPAGSLHLANVFMPHNAADVKLWQVFPTGKPFEGPDAAEIAKRAALVPKTLAKLRNGEPLKIVAWGDSVTFGGDASPGNDFPNAFARQLRERFPKSTITLVNAGIGATNSTMRLPGFEKDVLAHKPDLVTIEFVNDMGHSEQTLRPIYERVFREIRAAGGEIILITPHFVMAPMMKKEFPRGGETRETVDLLRKFAADYHVALADTSKRWAHLDEEGIPYITYLQNGINHPNDAGHELFVKDLMTFFPQSPTLP